ncbi:MAG: hypothetical protein GKR97_16340, partial [Rhizobiaceae bacterium]|nr:hypothetical protein [Rhizobiaceae bacterium]
MSKLFSPAKLGSLDLDNRIVVAPMCQYSAIDGSLTDWHLMHLGQFAVGGAGLVFVEATGVEAAGRITPGCPGLYSDQNEAAMARVINFFRNYGAAKIGIQLADFDEKGFVLAATGRLRNDFPFGFHTVCGMSFASLRRFCAVA